MGLEHEAVLYRPYREWRCLVALVTDPLSRTKELLRGVLALETSVSIQRCALLMVVIR